MDNQKIGLFISQKRKQRQLTQADLAAKLFVSDRAVSKWERGKSLPDASLMVDLCSILNISLSELFSGEELPSERKPAAAEEELLGLKKENEEYAKSLLKATWATFIPTFILVISGILFASFYTDSHPDFWPWTVVIIVISLLILIAEAVLCVRFEWRAGVYVCPNCGEKIKTTFPAVLFSMHAGTTRYLRCPKCHQKGWCKKKLK
jgi:transcriptional regulator with XRE-family HTH domain/DNA-directed RNA polymerase subunit RPC12/RpoP